MRLDAGKGRALLSDMIKQIKFVSVPVADQDRALDFYTEKLGFTIITDQPFDDKQRWIELRVPKAETRVVLFTTDDDKDRIGTFMNMSYTCDDLQKTYEELKGKGINFVMPPTQREGEGIRLAVCLDPDGLPISFAQMVGKGASTHEAG